MSQHICIKTSLGDITLQLTPEATPQTVNNFIHYINKKHYDNTVFHRVIPGFMVQGGGMDQDLNDKPTDQPIINESEKCQSNTKGTIAMARTSDPDSATSQFFINLTNNAFLDRRHPQSDGFGYCTFGEVIQGMDVVEKIGAVPTGSQQMHRDVPLEPVFIKSISLVDGDKNESVD